VSARLVVHVQPRAKRSEVAGRHGDAIKVRLQAPPVDGAANEELVRFLAETLGITKRSVTIVGGLTSRRKTVEIEGLGAEDLAARLA
jgi:uncharacterized protein (TIGR00251 family)